MSFRWIFPKFCGLTALSGAVAATSVLTLKVQDHFANQVSDSPSDSSSSSSDSSSSSSSDSVDLSQIELEEPGVPVDEDNFSI